MIPLLATLTIDPGQLVRVDVPDFPGAIATSTQGSMLLQPPTDGTPWRPAPVPEVDKWEPTEAIAALAVAPWHAAGFDGSGVKIAVFDIQWFQVEMRDEMLQLDTLGQTHDCQVHRSCAPPIDSIAPDFSFETGAHGVACAEVVHGIAPGAELHMVRVNGLTTLENAVDWAIREDIDIVSMSMSFFNESFYDGTGAINQQADRLVDAGILMVASAGNYARQHHWADFVDTNLDGRHDFPWGTHYLPIYLSSGSTTISLMWDDFYSCGATDLDAFVYDPEGDLVGRSTGTQDADGEDCRPVETVSARASSSDWHFFVVHRKAGTEDVRFDIMGRGGTFYRSHTDRSLTDPGSHPGVFTVGAVRAEGYRFNDVEGFSSQGPSHAGVDKPDIAGPDGLSTATYGKRGFFGTSAATPAVAAAIALLMDADPSLNPFEAARKLQATALDREPVWTAASRDMGAGLARLPPLDDEPRGCGGPLLLPILFWLPALGRRRELDS
jgi:hypothetical protein